MATLSSTSTLAEVQAAYDDNAGYAAVSYTHLTLPTILRV